ncbi:MAG: o-succinylbenzoate synthase [Actinomycetota bacterium]|nr:o-succinylbenzoate synthase [Actinomycetota bacterium]
MQLESFDLYRYRLPLTAALELEGATLYHREGLLLRLVGDDGSEGWGETAPLPGFSEEDLDGAAARLDGLAEVAMGRAATGDWVDPEGGFGLELGGLSPTPSVRFGFELALWNLYAASTGTTLPDLIAYPPRPTVPVNGLLSSLPDKVLGEARHMRDLGYETLKLKVGGRSVAEDVHLVRALGEELGEAVSLRLDANRAWGFEEAAEFLRGASGVRFEYVEEPLADPSRLPELVKLFGVPVALDESLVEIEPGALEEYRYTRAVVLKPTLLGGISRTLRLAKRALSIGMTPVISSAYESGVGTAALVALAAGIGDRAVPAGLDTYRRLAADVLVSPLGLPAPSVGVREVVDASREIDVLKLEIV